MAAASTISPTNTLGRCQICGSMRQTSEVSYQRNIGMLIPWQTRTIRANMGKSCVHKSYWEYTGKNLLLGPWGTISLIITPIYLVTNTVSYVSALHKLRGALE